MSYEIEATDTTMIQFIELENKNNTKVPQYVTHNSCFTLASFTTMMDTINTRLEWMINDLRHELTALLIRASDSHHFCNENEGRVNNWTCHCAVL